jgi:cyclophilin family peptidyl-prolyl cis-trans isomerase/protein-disulfide isomerase
MNRARFLLLFFILGFSIAACQSAATPSPTSAPAQATPLPALPTAAGDSTTAAGCTVVSSGTAPEPPADSPYAPASDEDWQRGPAGAPITFIEYADFQCPGCALLVPVLAQLEEEYPEEVRVIFRHFPLLSIHDKAALGTQATEAAGAQGKFWELHDALFTRQAEWANFPPEHFEEWLVAWALQNDLDVDQFTSDLNSDANAALVQEAWDSGQEAGIAGTPFLLINGIPYGGPLDYNSLNTIIQLLLLEDRQFTECPEMAIDPVKEYVATLETEKGDVTILLYPEVAPLAVNSFVFLARQGWFDGIPFHRVIPGFVAQTGDPSGTGFGGPGYAFDNETDPEIKFDRAGLVGMANSGPNSNGSQFFITFAPVPNLDGSYTIFGEVISGMDVVESLTPQNPADGPSEVEPDLIERVTIEER